MISSAKLKFVPLSARKARQVIQLIQGRKVDTALAILDNVNKGACAVITKLVKSALANAKRFPTIKEEDLFISRFIADGGPMMKRYKAQAMGRATMIRRRMCHLSVELDTAKQVAPQPEQAEGVKKPTEKTPARLAAKTAKAETQTPALKDKAKQKNKSGEKKTTKRKIEEKKKVGA
jgi:large subunit ribosomal protein L22